MDDEDGRCLLDVICDPQALNDFLHGSEKIDSDDLLDNTGDAASAFFEGAGLHVQETSGNHLNAEQSQPTTSVDLDFLEDDILGSPSGGGANLQNSDQPCDILQQSLQEANITEQTLEAEAELDLGSFQLPTLQPVVHTASDGTPQIFSGGADLIGLQQPAVLTHQALVQQSVGADVVNKAISVQPFLQQVGLGNVTIQPISNLQGLPNGSPSGALGIGQIQVVGQQVMAINQPAQQIIAKQVQPSQVATMPVGSYITQTAPEQQQVTLASAGVSPQNAGLVIQKNLPAAATTTLNGSSMFGSVSAAQGSQPLTVTSNLSSPLVQAQNVIIHRTPTPIQPKPAGVLQQKLYQITPKPFGPNNTTLTLQNEAALQQQKTQQNLTFMAGKAGQNVVLSGFQPGLPANMFKQPPPQQQTLNKPMSVHLLNQGSSIVIPAQHVPQAMLQGQNQFLLPGQLTGTSTVQIPQQLSALQANMGGQILTTSHPSGQTHIITSQGPGGQLITNQALPAQILTNQNLASQLNLGQVLTSQNAHGTAHILSAPIQLQPGQVGQPTLFQMPVSLAGSLTTQSQPTVAASLTSGAISQSGQTVIQGVTLPNPVAMLNATESLNQTMTIQAPPNATSQSPGLIQPQSTPSANLLPGDQANMLTVQSTSLPSAPSQLQLNVQQQTSPPQQQAQIPVTSQSSPNLVASSPEKIILGQTAAGTVISQDSMQMFLQQKDQSQQQKQQQQQQQQFYSPALKMQQESSMNESTVPPHLPMPLPIYSIATTALNPTSSVPASVIVSSSVGTALQPPASRELNQNHNLLPVDSKVPQFSTGPSQQALACQLPSGQQKLPGASPSHSLPHPSLGESPQLQPAHLSQIQSPHQSRPPSQPQPLSRPPSRPHSRPPSQPQTLSRPPSEPLSRSCTPQTQMQNLYVIQNQIASSPHGSSQHPLRPPSQPQVPFQAPQAQPEGQPQLATPPHLPLQVQLAPQLQPQPEAQGQGRLQAQIQASSEVPHSHSPHFQLQFPAQGPIKPPTPTQTLHLTPEQQRSFQMVSNQFQAFSTIPAPVPQQKQLMDRFQQVPQGIILQTKQSTSTSQAPPALSQFSSQSSSVLVSSQGQQVTMTTTPAQAPAVHGHTPVPTTIQSSSTGSSKAAPGLEKAQVPRGTTSGGGGGGQQQPAQCTAVLQQQTPVLVKSASVSIAAAVPAESKTFSSSSTTISGGKATSGQGKPTVPQAVQQSVQAKPGVISSASGLNLGKGQLQLQVVGKGLSQVMSSAPTQIQQQYESKLGSLKKAPPMLQPSKEACFLEQLHKHQGAVLRPDYKTSFRSFEDAFQRLLPYHVYQGTLPSPHDYRKDEEFEMVSTQLLKRTQAMLNKYRLLLLEESRRVSPSAEMVMIDRMFIQEEKTTLALDKQLAKEKPDEYVSSSSRSQSFASSAAQGTLPSNVPLTSENLKSPPVQMPTHINPTKLVIKHSGGSPSVTWAKASPSLDGDEDALPSRSKPPIKTYEARSRIGLKLKIKQEAGLSKVVHNTALDPVHQTPPPVCTVIKTADQHSSTSSVTATTTAAASATTSAAGQMNGTADHLSAAPTEKKPLVTYCRLPLRKTYRENVDAFVAEKAPDASLKGSLSKSDMVPSSLIIKQDGGSRSVITSHKSQESPSTAVAQKSRSEENTKPTFFNRSDARSLVMQGSPTPPKTDDSTSGLMKELAEVEDEFYQRMIKTEPLDHGSASELAWEVPLPPAKRRKSESFDVDNASFSSDSPPDDSLNEHLQSAIDSILNLQQPQAGSQNTRTSSSSYNSSSSPFSSPVHRTDPYLAPNHNGGLGTRTLNR